MSAGLDLLDRRIELQSARDERHLRYFIKESEFAWQDRVGSMARDSKVDARNNRPTRQGPSDVPQSGGKGLSTSRPLGMAYPDLCTESIYPRRYGLHRFRSMERRHRPGSPRDAHR